ncbi:MAG: ECF transporter S component [Christensenellales bacterium]
MTPKIRTKTLVITSMLAALVFVFTYLIKIPVNASGAYMNIGDCVIYCSGLLVGAPWAAAAAGIGSALSDLLLGFPVYAPATLVIKAAMGLLCAELTKKGGFGWFAGASILGGAIMVVGYGVFEWICFGWSYAVGTIVFNLIQWIAGVAGALALYYPIRRVAQALLPPKR